MSLQSAIEAELPQLRAEAESRMTSRAKIRRVNAANPTTIVNGFEVANWLVVHTDLPLRIGGGAGYRTVRIGETETQVAVRIASFPADTFDLDDDDMIEVTAGENAGAVLRIVEGSWADQQTARRVPVVEERRPEEWT